MPRLFTAIELDAAARERVAHEQMRLTELLRGAPLRWVRPEHIHLTMIFVGEVPQAKADAIGDAMNGGFDVMPFTLSFGGFGAFPPRGAPRVLWMGVTSGVGEAVRLHGLVASRLEAIGVPREARPLSPHLTLARWRTSRPSDRPRSFGTDGEIVASIAVSELTLFESRLSSAGPTYVALAHAKLAAALH